MAGTGKTTLVQRLNAHLHAQKRPPYVINLDPAVAKLPYGPNIDIRDTVNYKEARGRSPRAPSGPPAALPPAHRGWSNRRRSNVCVALCPPPTR